MLPHVELVEKSNASILYEMLHEIVPECLHCGGDTAEKKTNLKTSALMAFT